MNKCAMGKAMRPAEAGEPYSLLIRYRVPSYSAQGVVQNASQEATGKFRGRFINSQIRLSALGFLDFGPLGQRCDPFLKGRRADAWVVLWKTLRDPVDSG